MVAASPPWLSMLQSLLKRSSCQVAKLYGAYIELEEQGHSLGKGRLPRL